CRSATCGSCPAKSRDSLPISRLVRCSFSCTQRFSDENIPIYARSASAGLFFCRRSKDARLPAGRKRPLEPMRFAMAMMSSTLYVPRSRSLVQRIFGNWKLWMHLGCAPCLGLIGFCFAYETLGPQLEGVLIKNFMIF